MVAFFSWTLAISIVGLMSLLLLKRYELSTGRVVLGGLRPKIGHFFHLVLVLFERGVPAIVRVIVRRMMRGVRTQAKEFAALSILLFEHSLERILHFVRRTSTMPQSGGSASQFLQEVAAHKQKLLRRKNSKRVIVEE